MKHRLTVLPNFIFVFRGLLDGVIAKSTNKEKDLMKASWMYKWKTVAQEELDVLIMKNYTAADNLLKEIVVAMTEYSILSNESSKESIENNEDVCPKVIARHTREVKSKEMDKNNRMNQIQIEVTKKNEEIKKLMNELLQHIRWLNTNLNKIYYSYEYGYYKVISCKESNDNSSYELEEKMDYIENNKAKFDRIDQFLDSRLMNGKA